MSALGNPFREQLSLARAMIVEARAAAVAGDAAAVEKLTRTLVPALGRVARSARDGANVALVVTAQALLERFCDARGDAEEQREQLVDRARWMMAVRADPAYCSECGRGWRRGDAAAGWKLWTSDLGEGDDKAREMVATCSVACSDSLSAARWPGYVSFRTEEAVRELARLVGFRLPRALGSKKPKRTTVAPS